MYSSSIHVSLNQECPDTVLEGCNPAGFCVLQFGITLSLVKAFSFWYIGKPRLRALRTGFGHPRLKPRWLAVLVVMKCEQTFESMKRSYMTTDHWQACWRSRCCSYARLAPLFNKKIPFCSQKWKHRGKLRDSSWGSLPCSPFWPMNTNVSSSWWCSAVSTGSPHHHYDWWGLWLPYKAPGPGGLGCGKDDLPVSLHGQQVQPQIYHHSWDWLQGKASGRFCSL